MGAVARLGIGGFVKAEAGPAAPEGAPKIEVVASRREQKRQLMPPPPQRPSQPRQAFEAAPRGFQNPDWSCDPPSEGVLDVVKAGQVIDRITLRKAGTLFGRSPMADVVLDHPSLSRQHAALCYHKTSRCWVLLDLNSAHGTAVDGRQVPKNTPVELQEGATLRFAASSRDYVLRRSTSAEGSATVLAEPSKAASGGTLKRQDDRLLASTPEDSQVKRRKGRVVQWADESKSNIEAPTPLEQVIGYSDSKDFSAKVGPSPSSDGEGKFANLVESRVVRIEAAGERPKEQQPKTKRVGDTDRGKPRAPQPLIKASLFDWLPPPAGGAKALGSS
ncbi:g6436 [Coccomyxa elongata]